MDAIPFRVLDVRAIVAADIPAGLPAVPTDFVDPVGEVPKKEVIEAVGDSSGVDALPVIQYGTAPNLNSGVASSSTSTNHDPALQAGEEHRGVPESASLRRLRLAAAFAALFLAGWNGGSTGALLPYIERAYGLSYAKASLLFISAFFGYVGAAITTGVLGRRLGYGHSLAVAVGVQLAGNIINGSQQKSFGLMCFGFLIVGFGFSTQLGLFHAYFALLRKPLLYTGVLHGIFGLGAFASPLVATAMVTSGAPYHVFYLTNVGMNIPVLALVFAAFHKLQALPRDPSELESSSPPKAGLRRTISNPTVWILSLFLMCYVGAEDSIGGWTVSYVRDVRNGSPQSASWVTSSFYLGIAVGRILLPALNMFIGERSAVFVYLALALAMELIAWLVPLLATTAVATAIVGLAISTFYAAVVTTAGRLLPRAMHAEAFAFISSVGQSGSAFFPLLIGLISTRKGIWVVEPTVVALLCAQAIFWFMVPKTIRRRD